MAVVAVGPIFLQKEKTNGKLLALFSPAIPLKFLLKNIRDTMIFISKAGGEDTPVSSIKTGMNARKDRFNALTPLIC